MNVQQSHPVSITPLKFHLLLGGLSLSLFFIALTPLQASNPAAGDYPLNLSGYYPDTLLLNANKFIPTSVGDLFTNKVLSNTDESIVTEQKKLEQWGFTPFLYYWGDFLANPVGGLSHGADWTQLTILGGEIHLDPLGWRDGSLVVSFSDGVGYDLGQKVGNIFTPSQAQSFQTFANNALYLKQKFLDGKVELRVGRFTSASVFASLPAMGSLPVSGAVNGTPTSFFTNLSGWHSTGKPAWAAYAKVQPTSDTYIKGGILEVNPQANQYAYHGFDMRMSHSDGTLLLTEWGWTPTFQSFKSAAPASLSGSDGKSITPEKLTFKPADSQDMGYSGIYMAGAYLQNYPQTQFNGQINTEAYGFYLQGQQLIWRNQSHPKQNLSLWGGATYSPQTQVALLPVMAYAGLYIQGLVAGRDRDITLLNVYTGGVSSSYAQATAVPGKGLPTQETVTELSYIIQLTEHFQFQPDLQWVVQPSGFGSIPNALIIGFQVAAQF